MAATKNAQTLVIGMDREIWLGMIRQIHWKLKSK